MYNTLSPRQKKIYDALFQMRTRRASEEEIHRILLAFNTTELLIMEDIALCWEMDILEQHLPLVKDLAAKLLDKALTRPHTD